MGYVELEKDYMKRNKVASTPTIKRLPAYLHVIEAAAREGKEYISGTVIAEELDLEAIQVRKDLATTGIIGKPRLGFPVHELIETINTFLDWNRVHRAILLGSGHLGSALLGYKVFPRHGLNIVAAFDVDADRIGTAINGVPVFALPDLKEQVTALGVQMAILTVPSTHAQQVADLLVDCGISAIWNFTNIKIKVPENVVVQKEDLSSGYAVLSVKMRLLENSQSDA
jgi:redox-sensing transcriptional repressor